MWSISTILLQTVWEATWGVWGRKGRVEAGPPRANPAGSWPPRGCLSKQLGGPHSFGHYVRGGKNSRRPSHTAPSLAPWLELQHGMRAPFTFAVSIIIDLDFGSSEAGISMQLTVVEVGLAIAATHRPLVRFALLKQIVEDAGTVKAESVCAPHTHTHTHTHSHLVRRPPQQRWLLPCQGTGSLSSGISDPTLLSVGGITSPCSPSWCSVPILALGHLFYSVKRNTHSLTPILSN